MGVRLFGDYLFYIERVGNEKNKRGKVRLAFRLKYSRSVVQSIMKALHRMKEEKDAKKYGKMVIRTICLCFHATMC